MFIIGTAGHIDHGKSSIIKRLTGIDPDRLPEEKERGMTIDLGFAWYDTSDGERIGIVDVPGHERFVRNMIAGAGGIDAVILVVAADDGWMPQSQEHLQITRLLGIRHGIAAISKIDLADSGWIDLVEDDIKEKLIGTPLENSPVVRLSSETGEGFDQLRDEIEKLSKSIVVREDIAKPRLFIDRSFVLSGMGGVVAGTLRGGVLAIGQEVTVFPARRSGKVRTLQSHGQQVNRSQPGQRTAVSLTGIDKEYLKRGGVLSSPEIVRDYPEQPVLALAVTMIPESPVALEDRRRLLLIVGTTELEGEVRLLQKENVSPGREGIILFKPFSPVLAFIGDRFILRLPTPQVTVGGGMILDMLRRFPRKKELARFDYLRKRLKLNLETLITTQLEKQLFIHEEDFLFSNYSADAVHNLLLSMTEQSLLEKSQGRYYRPQDVRDIVEKVLAQITQYFGQYPHREGVPAEKIAVPLKMTVDAIDPILRLLCNKNMLVKRKNLYDLTGRKVSIAGPLKEMAEALERELRASGSSPPTLKEL
ncbi:MAG: selenocysteine-specific translation elongation factor, partial [Candidatus Zixiibacteriota bacterium]